MGTLFVVLLLVIIIFCAVMSIRKRIKYGSSCCGSHDAPPTKIKVHDKNKSHYPYTYTLTIDGMHCSNCVRHVENALNVLDGVWAMVCLENKTALVRSKNQLNKDELSKIIAQAGYTVIDFTS